MDSHTPTDVAPVLTEAKRAALISLLADDDPQVYQTVRRKLISYGDEVQGWLRPYLLHPEPVLRRRAREVVQHFQRRFADERFLAFCLNQGEDLELERGVGLLSQTRYPEASLEAFQAILDQYANDLLTQVSAALTPQQKLLAVKQYLFEEHGFHGNPQYETDPENCYFNRILERRTGNPIGLCAVYLFVCRRLGLPVAGIGLPGHFICRFQSPTLELYIDCFNKGRFLTKGDCIRHLHATNHGLHEGYLAPVSTRRILMRMCANLQQTYLQREDMEEASRIKRYLVALAN